jgi:hypothetical protein
MLSKVWEVIINTKKNIFHGISCIVKVKTITIAHSYPNDWNAICISGMKSRIFYKLNLYHVKT